MGFIEVLIAIFLTSVGIMALLALQPTGWKTMAKSDYVGRAAGILYKTLENYEILIVNPCYVPTVGTQATAYFYTSGQSSAVSGDILYTVNATITQVNVDPKPRVYRVTVTVTWPPINSTGIKESQIVTTQPFYDFPPNCTEI